MLNLKGGKKCTDGPKVNAVHCTQRLVPQSRLCTEVSLCSRCSECRDTRLIKGKKMSDCRVHTDCGREGRM